MGKSRIIPVTAAVLILSGCTDFYEVENLSDSIEPPVKPVQNTMPEVKCVADEIHDTEWYWIMCDAFKEGRKKAVVPVKVKNGDVKKALAVIDMDYPEIFWLGGTYYASTATDGSEVSVDFLKDFDTDKIPEMLAELEDAADKLIDGIPDGSSDYEKILYVHDYIAENTEYDYDGAEASEFGLWGSSYGCLVQGKAVCSGYAEAFQYIMNRLGIECGICTGSNHEWNYVKVDGEYYWTDITWDDIGDSAGHTYLLFNTDQLLRTRTFMSVQGNVPECTSLERSYFMMNGGYFETYDEKAVIDYVNGCSGESQCEMMFGSFEAYEEAIINLIGCGEINKSEAVKSQGMKYVRNDDMFVLDIVFKGDSD
ncbi:MAG: hypothetical protein K2J26_01165 [Ruminococcus sp.]|nr:hypothetical protein [Ruminococcus sp.]